MTDRERQIARLEYCQYRLEVRQQTTEFYSNQYMKLVSIPLAERYEGYSFQLETCKAEMRRASIAVKRAQTALRKVQAEIAQWLGDTVEPGDVFLVIEDEPGRKP